VRVQIQSRNSASPQDGVYKLVPAFEGLAGQTVGDDKFTGYLIGKHRDDEDIHPGFKNLEKRNLEKAKAVAQQHADEQSAEA
jgi:hypothetical protein